MFCFVFQENSALTIPSSNGLVFLKQTFVLSKTIRPKRKSKDNDAFRVSLDFLCFYQVREKVTPYKFQFHGYLDHVSALVPCQLFSSKQKDFLFQSTDAKRQLITSPFSLIFPTKVTLLESVDKKQEILASSRAKKFSGCIFVAQTKYRKDLETDKTSMGNIFSGNKIL